MHTNAGRTYAAGTSCRIVLAGHSGLALQRFGSTRSHSQEHLPECSPFSGRELILRLPILRDITNYQDGIQTFGQVATEVGMPLMSGEEALCTLRAKGFQQPIIRMSAMGQAQPFMHDGTSGFLAKPFTIDASHQAIAWQIGRS